MFSDQKKKILQSKCNACGNINNLDAINKAGAYLIKNLPKSDGGEFNNTEEPKKSKKGQKDLKEEEENKEEDEK